MKLPNLETAVVPPAKITDYLLSETHPDGRHKARFFPGFGFSFDNRQALEHAVRQHISDHEVAKVEPSAFGARYVVEGIMTAPDGRSPLVRTVWFIRHEGESPQFVTAYPRRRRDDD
jgi:hypothetical protein